jgi:hypothetical protein
MFLHLPKHVIITWCEIGAVGGMAQNIHLKVCNNSRVTRLCAVSHYRAVG